MTLDPRTPILVGTGQVDERGRGVEPVDLMVRAAREAAADAGSARLLELVDSVRVVGLLSWRYRDPGALVGERIGATVRHTGYSGNGGSTPQVLVNGSAEDIAAGRADVVLIGGAESWRTRMKLRAQKQRPEWSVQDESVPAAEIMVTDVPMADESERRIGLDRPSYVYPLFEQALRVSAGRSLEEHREFIGGLWSRFSKIAATNPNAWVQREYTAAEIATPSPENRMISTPYTKLLNSNNMVDQGAVLLMCSVETAARLGIPRENWVFPQSGTESHDTYAIAERGALDGSPAIRIAGARALELAGIGLDDVAHVDVYSCFPSAVQVAANELGLALDDPGRPLTVTGGLTFGGGPWNNYVSHSIATMAKRVRESPGSYGLVTANSGYLTKHAMGVYRTEPPAGGFRRLDVQAEVAGQPTTAALMSYAGTASAESWTVVYGRDGSPERGFLAARTAAGERTLAATTDAEDLARLTEGDVAGQHVSITEDGQFHFARR
ncbi:acetyl-CoA acetyltransferase [Rhodococcus sp. WB1]|uniref:acetyl-CoA acetyltransferase n=1 Tax=unclassified Rhodococcus (in: high G+C Gram-positive bacteria) TaxID=192944 RepID=UPI00081A38FA|nr:MULTISPECIES: acetyl-CoA acetyltransferase [unclassified Rhodococcus (in: high G+C Gram-positive bacteria)]ANZ26541.1 acetyl-CoA acetyltransferase [Rhodococcus sp. WB1]USC16462.1 acetyl-CoA acetyltransferase [Rhodococcus sp. 11-3]